LSSDSYRQQIHESVGPIRAAGSRLVVTERGDFQACNRCCALGVQLWNICHDLLPPPSHNLFPAGSPRVAAISKRLAAETRRERDGDVG